MLSSKMKSFVASGAFAFALSAGVVADASAQAWPSRPITLIVPYAAGGGADFVSRLIADDLTRRLGWTIQVENRGGANGTIGSAVVARAAPDGYTIMLIPSAPMVNATLLSEGLTYDMHKDFTIIGKVVYSPIVVGVNKDVPVKTLKELVDLAKARPGSLNVGNVGPNSTAELLSMMFMSGTGTELTRVPYKGSGQLVPDFLSNRLQVVMDFPGPYAAHVKSGDVRFLATFNDKRLEGYPDLPTLAEAGFSQVPNWQGWFGLFAPRGLPEDIRARIAREVNAWLATPEAKEKLATGGYIPTPEPPEAVRALMQNETAALSKLIEKYNIKKTPL